jgi:hypothetical protein
MEGITLNHDIRVLYVTATSFPDGIMDAYKRLHALFSSPETRKYFGLSRPENGVIVYKAAAEELYPGEAHKLNGNELIIKSGKYIASTIRNYMKDVQEIGRTFQVLLSHPGLDPDGYCVEWYFNNTDVQCMIRMLGQD